MKRLSAKKLTGFAAELVAAVVVLAFLGLHSINFFTFVFPPDQLHYAWLGFGLTGGGFVAYLVIFLWKADTILKKWTALIISAISGIGEILTAIFGMQVEAWKKSGWALTEDDFSYMLLAVGLLALAHAISFTVYLAGDKIGELFADDDGDGTPNAVDPDYQRNKNKGQSASRQPKSTGNNAPNQPQGTQYTLPSFLSASGIKTEQAFEEFLEETETFGKAWQVLRDRQSADGYKLPAGISHKNFNEVAGKIKSNGHLVNP
jgi:hypothetical protein